jgi:hypothetical protein
MLDGLAAPEGALEESHVAHLAWFLAAVPSHALACGDAATLP